VPVTVPVDIPRDGGHGGRGVLVQDTTPHTGNGGADTAVFVVVGCVDRSSYFYCNAGGCLRLIPGSGMLVLKSPRKNTGKRTYTGHRTQGTETTQTFTSTDT
jgi:hypothetical protein